MPQPKVFLGLGSNKGGPRRQLEEALSRLGVLGVDVALVSSWYRTAPLGGPPQPWFINAVAGVRFEGAPEELLRICQRIEIEQGRRRTVTHGPRTLDLDLLLFGEQVRETPFLTLPHPRLPERRFVLVPLVEIAPETVDPVSGLDMRELLARCPDRSPVVRIEDRIRRLAHG